MRGTTPACWICWHPRRHSGMAPVFLPHCGEAGGRRWVGVEPCSHCSRGVSGTVRQFVSIGGNQGKRPITCRRVTGSSPVGGAAPAPSPASQAAGLRRGWGTGCWKTVCPNGALPASLSAKDREPVACSMSLRKFRVLDGSGNRGAAEGRRRFTQPRAAPVHPPAWGGTSLPETGGGWPDSVCSLAGPNESVLFTMHIPQFFRSYHACFHRDRRQPRRHRHHRLRQRCRLPDQVIDHRGWSPVVMSDPGPLCGAGFFMSGERSGECILRGRSVTIS